MNIIAKFFKFFGMKEHQEMDSDETLIEDLLPPQVLAEIFQRIDLPKQLIKSCCLVCRRWNEILSARGFWIDYLKRTQFLDIPFPLRNEPLLDLRKVVIFQPFERNLILNPSGEQGFEGWSVSGGGDNWIIESPPLGCNADADLTFPSAFATSFHWCHKHIHFDLHRYGLEPEFLDKYRPAISVSEYNSYRFDCGAIYKFLVALLPVHGIDHGFTDILNRMEFASAENPHIVTPTSLQHFRQTTQWCIEPFWQFVEHTFKDYPRGIRYVRYEHSGVDTQFWKGHYGAKIAKSSLIIHLGDGTPKQND